MGCCGRCRGFMAAMVFLRWSWSGTRRRSWLIGEGDVDGCAFVDAVTGGGRLRDDGGASCYVGLGYDSGCGDGECVDVFDDAYADGCYAGGGGGEREAGEGGHDEAGGW